VAKRRYSKEFREFAVERLRGCENIVALAKELHVSRRQLYRWRDELDPEIPGMEAAGQNARASTLRKEVNHLKRVLAEKTLEVREDNLLAVQPRQFVVTTKSDHKLEVYLNLARRLKLTGIDQLWVADITYIRLKTEFVYLAVILDGFSRYRGVQYASDEYVGVLEGTG
jgi:putative transposase